MLTPKQNLLELLKPNGKPDRLDPMKFSVMERGAAPFGRLLTLIVPLPDLSWPLLSKVRVGPAPEDTNAPLGSVSSQCVCH